MFLSCLIAMKNIQDAYSYLDGYSSSHCYMESVPEAVNRQEYRNESHSGTFVILHAKCLFSTSFHSASPLCCQSQPPHQTIFF